MNAPPVGQLIEPNLYDVAAVSPQDPRNAAARAIRGFLEGLTFTLSGVCKTSDKPFKLQRVTIEWPDLHRSVVYPTASIVERPGVYEGHNFSPTPIEETFNLYAPNTVLWKTAELAVDFQVDYWTSDNPTREAIAALLPVVFSPLENQSSIAVYSAPEYFSRPVRLLLKEQERIDNSEDAFSRIKRLSTVVTATIEAVHLRRVAEVQPETSFDVTDGS